MFRDRSQAGRRLAAALERLGSEAPVVLGLSRGGVPVAHEVARALGAPLDIVGGGQAGATGQVDLRGRTVILVDDGIAASRPVAAAVRSIRERGGERLILASPIGLRSAVEELSALVDEVVCLQAPAWLGATGSWYEDYSPPGDRELVELLGDAGAWMPPARSRAALTERELTIDAGGVPLPARLSVPAAPRTLVLFAHGGAGEQPGARDLRVVEALHRHGVATLLFDPLTPREEREEETGHRRFEVPFLGRRLVAATDWARRFGPLRRIPLALLGQGACAAAALVAAAERPGAIRSVVACGGRPDLACRWLPKVKAPVLLIVGGASASTIRRNREVLGLLPSGSRMGIFTGAVDPCEQAGRPEFAGQEAARWFIQHLEPGEPARGETPAELPAH